MGPRLRGRYPPRASRRAWPSSPPRGPRCRRARSPAAKRLFDHAYGASLEEQLALEARGPGGGHRNGGLPGGRRCLPREATAELLRPLIVETVDYHTAGEPFRIVTGGVDAARPGARSSTSAATRSPRFDDVRQLLVNEPRGHADMYGCFVCEPNDDGADLGVVFFHNAGYSTACGHGTIALVTWALEEGVLDRRDGEQRVVVDVPSGRLETWARVERGKVRVGAVSQRARVRVGNGSARRRAARSTSSFGGAFYASCPERVEPSELPRLIELGRRIKRDLEDDARDRPPAGARAARRLRRRSSGRPRRTARRSTQRNVTVFADGEVDRSPCGSGTSARLALLDASGAAPARLRAAASLDHRQRVPGAGGRTRRASQGSRPSSPRSRAAPTARDGTCSSSTRRTSSAPGSCCAS